MAINNNLLNGTDFIEGDVARAGSFNETFNAAVYQIWDGFQMVGLNTLRLLGSASIDWYSDSNDGWGDYYTVAAGRDSTVNTGSTNAYYDSGDDTYQPDQTSSRNIGSIVHDIPSGQFGSTISRVGCVPAVFNMVQNESVGQQGNIQFKFLHYGGGGLGGDDTGWLNVGSLHNVTEFSSPPTQMMIKLERGQASADNQPSISGFFGYAK